jgi:2-methylcitrate dehydratase PrpD
MFLGRVHSDRLNREPYRIAGENLKTLAQTMAEFTFELRYDSIPAEALTAMRRHLADTLACALAAHNTAPLLALRKRVLAEGGRPDATIIGTAEKVPAALAALVNGTMVRYLDGNDIFVSSRGRAERRGMAHLPGGVVRVTRRPG